jgi:NAD(P)-dependent dehydrogenase (short-subunit alcohol dehydrogenase family)
MSRLEFDGRVAIVTGSSRGIGRAHARLLASRGARVVVSGRDQAVDEVVAEIEAHGGRAVTCVVDVTAEGAGQMLVDTALTRFGRVDVVVSNASQVTRTSVTDTDLRGLRAQLELDVLGPFALVQAAWPHLIAQSYGRVVLTSSSSTFGSPAALPYSAGKSALIGLTRTLAASGAASDIKVNAIAPFGFSRLTAGNKRLSPAEIEARARLALPELVAAGVAALVHESCPVTGELFAIGAGRMTHITLAETRGYFDAALTPEDVVSHWSDILDEVGAARVGFDHAAKFYAPVPGWPARDRRASS